MAGAGMEPTGGLDVATIETATQAEAKEAEDYVKRKADDLKREGYRVEWEVRNGSPAQEIIACAKERNIDVVVITTHGRSGLGRIVFGSVADEVIRNSGLPVLVVNNKPTG